VITVRPARREDAPAMSAVLIASITELCPSNYSYTTAGAEDLAGDGGELYA